MDSWILPPCQGGPTRPPWRLAGRRSTPYGSGGLRRTRSVRRYTDRLIRARVAAARAPAHQYQPPSVTAATIKPAASKTSVKASPSRHHRGNPELTLWSVIGPKHHEVRRGMKGRHHPQPAAPGRIVEHRSPRAPNVPEHRSAAVSATTPARPIEQPEAFPKLRMSDRQTVRGYATSDSNAMGTGRKAPHAEARTDRGGNVGARH